MTKPSPDEKETRRSIAKEYVDKQLASMQKHGLRTKKLSKDEYQTLVDQFAQAIRA